MSGKVKTSYCSVNTNADGDKIMVINGIELIIKFEGMFHRFMARETKNEKTLYAFADTMDMCIKKVKQTMGHEVKPCVREYDVPREIWYTKC